MQKIIKALMGQAVEIKYADSDVQTGMIQFVRGDKATVGDFYGGAYSLTISEIKGVRIDVGQRPLLIIA